MSVPRHDGLLVDMVNEMIEEDYNITCDEISNKHVTTIGIQHVTRIQIQHVMRIRILHVNNIDLVQRTTTVNEDGGAEVDIMVQTNTEYKRWICHSRHKLLCKLCLNFPPPAMGARFTVFWTFRPCGPGAWLALLLTKAGPTTLNKR